jgi:hypothetical protein
MAIRQPAAPTSDNGKTAKSVADRSKPSCNSALQFIAADLILPKHIPGSSHLH